MIQTKVFLSIFLSHHVSWNIFLFAGFCDELFVKIVADEEEVEHAERMANWAAIKDLIEEDANEKRKFVYSPGICRFISSCFIVDCLRFPDVPTLIIPFSC